MALVVIVITDQDLRHLALTILALLLLATPRADLSNPRLLLRVLMLSAPPLGARATPRPAEEHREALSIMMTSALPAPSLNTTKICSLTLLALCTQYIMTRLLLLLLPLLSV